MKVTRNSPGNYTVNTNDGREWFITRNPALGSTPWVAYDANGKDTVLDPIATLRETLDTLAGISALNVKDDFDKRIAGAVSEASKNDRRYRFLRDRVDHPTMLKIAQYIGNEWDRAVDDAMLKADQQSPS
jgi:hypothetical protein